VSPERSYELPNISLPTTQSTTETSSTAAEFCFSRPLDITVDTVQLTGPAAVEVCHIRGLV